MPLISGVFRIERRQTGKEFRRQFGVIPPAVDRLPVHRLPGLPHAGAPDNRVRRAAADNRVVPFDPEKAQDIRQDGAESASVSTPVSGSCVLQQNVNRYESGTTPHTDFLITLALKEQVSVDWLLLGKGKMKRASR